MVVYHIEVPVSGKLGLSFVYQFECLWTQRTLVNRQVLPTYFRIPLGSTDVERANASRTTGTGSPYHLHAYACVDGGGQGPSLDHPVCEPDLDSLFSFQPPVGTGPPALDLCAAQV